MPLRGLRRFLYRMAGFEQLQGEVRVRTLAEVERVLALELLLATFGLRGLPPRLGLRLLPHAVPPILRWRRSGERELSPPSGIC